MKSKHRAGGREDDTNEVSRSQRRRDALAVLDLVYTLLDGPARLVESLALEANLKALIAESREVTQQVARKRQAQFLAKQLRGNQEAVVVIRRAFESSAEDRRRETARLHRLEHWRTRLIEEGDVALESLVEDYPSADRNALRQLSRQARRETDACKPPVASRKLFRLLSELLTASEGP